MFQSIRLKSIIKIIAIFIIIFSLIYAVSGFLRYNVVFQLSFYISMLTYYFFTDRNKLYNSLGFFKFLVIIILIFELFAIPAILLDISFSPFKITSNGFQSLIDHYSKNWIRVVVSIFLLPNILAFTDILVSKVTIIDIVIGTGGNPIAKGVYLVLISGTEVMERLRIYFKYHPKNEGETMKNISHYLAVPLALFFGIMKKFEYKLASLNERDEVLRRENE